MQQRPTPRSPPVRSSSSASSTGSNRRRRTNKQPSEAASGGNLLWTFLLIGVVICFLDSLYIIKYVVEGRHDAVSPATTATPRAVVTPQETDDDTNKVSDGDDHPQPSHHHKSLFDPPPDEEEEGHDVGRPDDHQHHVDEPLAEPPTDDQVLPAVDLADKEPLLALLREADALDHVDPQTLDKLPTWTEVTTLYGSEPVYIGLETCQDFQDLPDVAEHFVSTAGTFNTGTNLMAELLIKNCQMPKRMEKYGRNSKGVRWQVLWGKHTPVGDEAFRQEHKTYNDSSLVANYMFPAVTVRDPYKWMQSVRVW